ncbi:hypothetical protein B0H10DRAFT_1945108 [Mycena sp. CBHHK59/15]|nr:hypothetical protein B0H10DRAFT_1945108 [Mycena sp. CBHHK59/15]
MLSECASINVTGSTGSRQSTRPCSLSRSVILFPLTLLVGQAVCGSGVICHSVKSYPGKEYYSLSNGWVTTDLVSSILHDILENIADKQRSHAPQSVLAILVESAALQTSTTIGVLVTSQVGFVGQVVWMGIAPAILGISTVLIHARIGLGWAHESDRQTKSNPTRINFAVNEALEEEHEL